MDGSTTFFPSFRYFVNNNNFSQIPDKLVVPRAYKCYISLVSAQIPVSYYNLQANQLIFIYKLTSESFNRYFTFNIPKSWYSSTELADVIVWSGILAGCSTTSAFFCVYQGQTNKFQLEFQKAAELDFFSLTPNDLATQMGFINTNTSGYFPNAIIPSTAPNSWNDPSYPICLTTIGDQQADLSGTRYIQILTTYKSKFFSGGSNILETIPVNNTFGNQISYTGNKTSQLYDNILTDFSVQFLDDSGNTINFNGVGWGLVLEFSFRNPDTQPFYADTADISIKQQDPMLQLEEENQDEP